MRVLICGTGALASLVGARLQRTGRARVTLAGSWPEALERIPCHGIEVEESHETWSVHPRCVRLDSVTGLFDSVLVLVKAVQTAAVAPHAARALDRGGCLVTLQNGLGNRPVLERAANGPVGVGTITVGARLTGAGRVCASGPGRVVLGNHPALTPALTSLLHLFNHAHFSSLLTFDVETHVWRKLVVNTTINALTALHHVPNGALLERPDLRAPFEATARETAAVARAVGIELGVDPVRFAGDVATATATNFSSMLQDVLRGARTEIDALNGAVATEGRRRGVPTPVNDDLWRRVRELEARPPGHRHDKHRSPPAICPGPDGVGAPRARGTPS